MSFSRALARLAAQLLLGIAAFIWIVIAFFDHAHPQTQPWMAAGALCTVLALLRLGKGGAWVPWAAAIGLVAPMGVLAQNNGASPWLWGLWALVALGTQRWVRDGHQIRD